MLGNDDRWYLAIVATHVGDRSYSKVVCTRDVERLTRSVETAPPAPVLARCVAHQVSSTNRVDDVRFDGDSYTDSESDDGAEEEEAMVREDIARQFAEVQQIQACQQQQLPTPPLAAPPERPLNRPLDPGEPRDPVFRRAVAMFSREMPRKAYPQSLVPGAPHDWVERTSATVDLEISLAMARGVRSGAATPTDTSRRFDHLRKSLADESRARNPRQSLSTQALDQLRRKQETLRKKRKTNEEEVAVGEGDQTLDEPRPPRPLPQHIALLRMRRSQNGFADLPHDLTQGLDPQEQQLLKNQHRTSEPRRSKLVFACGPYPNYDGARTASVAVCKVRGLALRVAEATELATRARVAIVAIDMPTVLRANNLFVYRGTVWIDVPPEIADQLSDEATCTH